MREISTEKRRKGRKLVEEWNQTEWVNKNLKKRSYKPENSRIFLRDYGLARREVAYVPPFERGDS